MKVCRKHAKNIMQRQAGLKRNQYSDPMPRVYAKYLSKELTRTLEEQLAVSPQEQLQLYEELALMREAAGQAVKLYSVAHEAARTQPENTKRQELVVTASQIMAEALKNVQGICEAAARCEAQAKDKLSIHQLYFFINQIVHCIHEAAGGDVEFAERVVQAIKTGVKLPSFGPEGTAVTPDMDVTAMDNTVPRLEGPIITTMEEANGPHNTNGSNGHATEEG
jgi:hypothetical protein